MQEDGVEASVGFAGVVVDDGRKEQDRQVRNQDTPDYIPDNVEL